MYTLSESVHWLSPYNGTFLADSLWEISGRYLGISTHAYPLLSLCPRGDLDRPVHTVPHANPLYLSDVIIEGKPVTQVLTLISHIIVIILSSVGHFSGAGYHLERTHSRSVKINIDCFICPLWNK